MREHRRPACSKKIAISISACMHLGLVSVLLASPVDLLAQSRPEAKSEPAIPRRDGRAPTRTPKPAKPLKSAADEKGSQSHLADTRHGSLKALLFMSLFGPVTYDQLGVRDGTGVPKRDPARRSFLMMLRGDLQSRAGAFWIGAGVRLFDSVSNQSRGNWTDGSTAVTEQISVTSAGPRLELGLEFRRGSPDPVWRPRIGLGLERNKVVVSGSRRRGEADAEDIVYESTLEGSVLLLESPWVLQAGAGEVDFVMAIDIPLSKRVSANADTLIEEELNARLRHGLRTGVGFGIGAGYAF